MKRSFRNFFFVGILSIVSVSVIPSQALAETTVAQLQELLAHVEGVIARDTKVIDALLRARKVIADAATQSPGLAGKLVELDANLAKVVASRKASEKLASSTSAAIARKLATGALIVVGAACEVLMNPSTSDAAEYYSPAKIAELNISNFQRALSELIAAKQERTIRFGNPPVSLLASNQATLDAMNAGIASLEAEVSERLATFLDDVETVSKAAAASPSRAAKDRLTEHFDDQPVPCASVGLCGSCPAVPATVVPMP